MIFILFYGVFIALGFAMIALFPIMLLVVIIRAIIAAFGLIDTDKKEYPDWTD
jgi:hypothetical protein